MSEVISKLTRLLRAAAFLATVLPVAGQGPQPSISLAVTGPATVKAGSSIVWIDVVLTNITKDVINVPQSEPALGAYIGLDVRDASGMPTGKTRLYRQMTGDRTGKDAPASADPGVFAPLGRAGPPGPVQPLESTRRGFDLTTLFDITQPGKYTIQAQEADPMTGAIIKSNVFTLTVEK